GLAPRAHAESHHRVDALLDLPDQPHDILGSIDWHLDLDDRRHQLLVENVLAQRARLDVLHQGGDGILLLDGDARVCQRPAHLLNIAEPYSHAGTAELDGEADFADADATADVVGLHFFGAPPFDSGRFMRNARIRKRAANHAGPRQFFRLERRRRADI